MTSKACDSRTKSRKSSSVPVRLPRSRSLTLGGPATGANTTCRPPTRQQRAGLRAMRATSAGMVEIALLTMPVVEAHHLARIVHRGPGRAQHRAPARRQHPHALVLENVERRAMHARDLIVGEDPHRLEGVDEVSVARRARLGCRGAGSLGFSPARSHPVKSMPPLAARRAAFPWPPLAR